MSLRFFCAANVVTASVAARAFSSHRRSETTKTLNAPVCFIPPSSPGSTLETCSQERMRETVLDSQAWLDATEELGASCRLEGRGTLSE